MLEKKRVFFALDVQVPWPEHLPPGRLLEPNDRHATLAFLGEIPYEPLLEKLQSQFPVPPIKVGLVGFFSKCLFLPHRHPKVVAWEIQWTDDDESFKTYRKKFLEWLKNHRYYPKEHEGDWLCHVTVCRYPFEYSEWKKSFKPLPIAITNIHLYESLGHSKYKSLWSYPLIPAFEEIEHTADIAYIINAENLIQLHHHAQMALAFRYPPLLKYTKPFHSEKHEDIIMDLNEMIAVADAEIGCPFKAISFHGNIEIKNSVLQWEMIVDV